MSVQSIADIPPALITASAAFVGGILGTLLTIFVTPRLQHYFWKRQKREELRLAVVTDVNRLAAEFQSNYLFKDHIEDTSERALRFAQS